MAPEEVIRKIAAATAEQLETKLEPLRERLRALEARKSGVRFDAAEFGRELGEEVKSLLQPLRDRITELESRAAPDAARRDELQRQCDALRAEVAALGARTPMTFCGEHSTATDYARGAVVVSRGQLFVAATDVRASGNFPRGPVWQKLLGPEH